MSVEKITWEKTNNLVFWSGYSAPTYFYNTFLEIKTPEWW
jgi:hypothetical protein